MILKAIIDDQEYSLEIPAALVAEAEPYFTKLDADMDQGWQMSRDWVDRPNTLQRAQIVADKLLTALETESQKTGMLMAGYILSRLPGVQTVEIDVHGEIQNTTFTFGEQTTLADAAVPAGGEPMTKLAAMEQAGQEVTRVFKVGHGFRFSVLDRGAGGWQDSPVLASEAEAERLRQEAFKARYEALLAGRP